MGLALIETNTLSSIGTAIRNKTGETINYKPSQMAEAINGIKAGAEIPEAALKLTGNIVNKFSLGSWDWFLSEYGDQITTEGIYGISNAFNGVSVDIPFEINLLVNGGWVINMDKAFYNANISEVPVINGVIYTANSAFSGCKATRFRSDLYFDNSNNECGAIFNSMTNLLELPYLYNLDINGWSTTRQTSDNDYTYKEIYVDEMSTMFSGCKKIKSIPEDYADTWTVNRVLASQDFYNCQSLRSIPVGVLNKLFSNCIQYKENFYNCYALESIENFPITTARYGARRDGFKPSELTPVEITENMFYCYVSGGIVHNFIYGCGRLSKFTFAETAEEVKWSNQLIHFTEVGYDRNAYILGKGLGEFTLDNQVYDDATYAALKDNPDWWTADVNYSRYNKTSALETIASLPDTSAFGTNGIMFNSAQGSKTDGGAIGDMTAEEIAVAAAKGWTVGLI